MRRLSRPGLDQLVTPKHFRLVYDPFVFALNYQFPASVKTADLYIFNMSPP